MSFRNRLCRTIFPILLSVYVGVSGCAQGNDANEGGDKTKTFQGHPIEHWVERLRKRPVEELNKAGEEAIDVWVVAARDPKAVAWTYHEMSLRFGDATWTSPVYLAMLESPQQIYRQMALGKLLESPEVFTKVAPDILAKTRRWAKSGDDDDMDLAEQVVTHFANQDSPLVGSIDLVRALWPLVKNERSVRRNLLILLARTGPKSVPVVIDIYLQYEPELHELAYFTENIDRETIDVILAASRNDDVARRRLAAAMISRLARSDESQVDRRELVNEMIRLLTDTDLHIRRYMLEGAKYFQSDDVAAKTIPALEKFLSDQDANSRHAASAALSNFGEQALPSAQRAAVNKNAEVRIVAATLVGEIENVPDEGIEILLRLSKDDVAKVRRYAVYSLGETQSADPRVAQAILRALDDPATKDWATRALAELGPKAEQAVETLKGDLQSDDIRKRLQAAQSLWAITKDASLILPTARAVVRDDQGITMAGYGVTYQTVDGKRVEKRHPFRNPLSSRAAELLGKMGNEAEPAVDELTAMLDHKNPRARWAALKALGNIGPAATKAISALEKMAEEEPSHQIDEVLKKIKNTR